MHPSPTTLVPRRLSPRTVWKLKRWPVAILFLPLWLPFLFVAGVVAGVRWLCDVLDSPLAATEIWCYHRMDAVTALIARIVPSPPRATPPPADLSP